MPGPPLGPFVADDDHIAFLVFARLNGGERIFLAIEHARGPAMMQMLEPRHFHDGAFGREIAAQAHHAAGRRQRIVVSAHDLLVRIELHVLQIFGNRLARDGHAIAVDIAAVQQRAHQHRHAARFPHILGDIFAARFQRGEIGRALEDLRHIEQIEFDAGFVRHRGQMQRRIGRAAGRRHNGRRILECLARGDIARADILRQQFHHRLPRLQREIVALQNDRGRAGGIWQRQADRFGDASHRVGGELSAAGARTGAGVSFKFGQIAGRHFARRELADAFENIDDGDIPALEFPRHDRAAIEKHARHVEPQHRHHHAGQALVAAREADERVVAMAAHRQLDGIRDHFARNERGFHPLMAHRDAVGHGDGAEFARRAAGFLHAALGRLRLAHQRDVAGGGFVPARGDAHERLVDFGLRQPHRIEVGPVRCPVRPLGDMAGGKLGFVECCHWSYGLCVLRGGIHDCRLKCSAKRKSAGATKAPADFRRLDKPLVMRIVVMVMMMVVMVAVMPVAVVAAGYGVARQTAQTPHRRPRPPHCGWPRRQ